VSPNRTRSWLGIGSSSPRSSTAPNTGRIQAAPRFHRKWKPWWCEWHERTPAGAMIASSVRWATSVITCRIRPLETFCAATGLPRRVSVAGITRHPHQEWMGQIARSATQETWGHLHPCRYVLHDRDTKFCASFRSLLADGGVKTIRLPARSPNLNAFAERWVRSVKQECLSKLILFGEGPLSQTLAEFSAHYHGERNHQGKDNKLLFPDAGDKPKK
jgi:hypothetical protein